MGQLNSHEAVPEGRRKSGSHKAKRFGDFAGKRHLRKER